MGKTGTGKILHAFLLSTNAFGESGTASYASAQMHKLCLNSRDELIILDLQKIAYFLANGNYTRMCYISGETHLLSIGLSKIEEYLRATANAGVTTSMLRLGRSLIFNQNFLSEINLLKHKLTLSDREGHSHTLTVPKPLLKEYKEKINTYYSSRTTVS